MLLLFKFKKTKGEHRPKTGALGRAHDDQDDQVPVVKVC